MNQLDPAIEQAIESKIKITQKKPYIMLFTDEFEKFTGNPINRNVTKKHAAALLQSLKDNGYYEYTPILCDQNFLILDGHHKIEALRLYFELTGKRLEFAFRITFCETDEDRLREMQIHNAYKKDWTMKQTLKISNSGYAKFYKFLEKKFNISINFPGHRKNVMLIDYLDPSSVNNAIGIKLSKPDLASKKNICEQDQEDIISLFEVVYNTLLLFRKVPPLKRAFVNNCGKIVTLINGKKVDWVAWRSFVSEKYDEETINSEKLVIDLERVFRKFYKEK